MASLLPCGGSLPQREALTLRGAALDGCEGTESLGAVAGASISASTILAAEAEAQVAALQQLLQHTQAADAQLQGFSGLLPIESSAIPADLAVRLTSPWMRPPLEEGATKSARLQVFRCLQRRSAVGEGPETALASWLPELLAFAEGALDAKM